MILNSNSRYLSERLGTAGVDVVRITAVGDAEDMIEEAVRQAMQRVDWVFATGGLGSTHDDISKRVLAKVFQSGLRRDEKVASMLIELFKARGRKVPAAVQDQCQVPEKADILYNDKGTAPGLHFREAGKHLYALPGVPFEMEHLFEKYILPELASAAAVRVGHRIIRVTGIMEAGLWEKIGPVDPLQEWVSSVASLPSHLGVNIRLSAVGKQEQEVFSRLDAADRYITEKIGRYIYGRDGETLEGKVGELLGARTLAVAESCTGGLIGHRLTQVAGSSEYFLEGAVTYSNAAKTARLGLEPELLQRHGAVSREVALAMADGIRRTSGADIGLAVTGIAGPGGGTPEKPVGLTFIALSDASGNICKKFLFHQSRSFNKERAAQAALNLLRLRLQREG